MAQVMPTQRREVRGRHGILKRLRIAIINGFPVPLKDIFAIGVEFLELSQKSDRFARKRDAMRDSCLHLFTGYPEPAILHIDSIPRECRHGSHSKARGHRESRGERQVFGQLFAEPFKLGFG